MKLVKTLGIAVAAVVCLLTSADAVYAASQAEEARLAKEAALAHPL